MKPTSATAPLHGLVAGAFATVGMSGLMVAGRRLGVLGRMPPEKITSRFLDEMGVRRGARAQDALATAFHVAFGAAAGAVYGELQAALGLRANPVLQGALFGTAVWAISYRGWVPALGIMPPPERDRPGRPAVMLAAHWVYGGLLGWLCSRSGGSPAAALAADREEAHGGAEGAEESPLQP